MEIKKFESIKEALNNILPKDSEYIIVRHELYKGQGIKRHFHKKANEWLILDKGSYEARIDDSREVIKANKEVVVLNFPISTKHSIEALTDIKYLVVRDQQDETYYSNRLF